MAFDILFIISVAVLASIPILWLLWKSQIEDCRFRLFAVRDDLVFLIATEKIDRDNIAFRYYYENVNRTLALTETVHLEELINFIKGEKFSADNYSKYKETMSDVFRAVNEGPDSFREAITQYYLTLREIILINSNFFVATYLALKHRRKLYERLLQMGVLRKEPKAVKAVEQLENECENMDLACA